MKRNGHLTEQLVLLNVTMQKLTIVNVIDSRTYSSYEVYDAQFTEKSKHFAEELLNGYKEVATNAGVKDVETRLEFGSPKSIIPKSLHMKLMQT